MDKNSPDAPLPKTKLLDPRQAQKTQREFAGPERRRGLLDRLANQPLPGDLASEVPDEKAREIVDDATWDKIKGSLMPREPEQEYPHKR